jgi:hypothetical protein
MVESVKAMLVLTGRLLHENSVMSACSWCCSALVCFNFETSSYMLCVFVIVSSVACRYLK